MRPTPLLTVHAASHGSTLTNVSQTNIVKA